MNEASNFCNGVCWQNQTSKDPIVNKIPYLPGQRSLEWKSITYDAVHKDGTTEYDRHNLFGFMGIKATNGFFKKIDKRPFIISRSTYSGSGKYGSHWLGDNSAEQRYMKASMQGIFNYNIFGTTFVGSDICGFGGNTTKELCTRWQTLGSFYPFSRNHNAIGCLSQEPYQWNMTIPGKDITYTDVMRKSIRLKYGLLKYYYTQLYYSNKYGGAFIKPLFFEFPEDPKAYGDSKNQEYIEQNIMIGSALKFSPAFSLDENTIEKFYFPKGRWSHILNGQIIKGPVLLEEETKFEQVRLHIREGHIIPWQCSLRVSNTQELFDISTSLLVFLNENSEARGSLVLDNGYSTNKEEYNEYFFFFKQIGEEKHLKVKIQHMSNQKVITNDEKVGKIRILDAQTFSQVKSVSVTLLNGESTELSFRYNETSNIFMAQPEKDHDLYWHAIDIIKFI